MPAETASDVATTPRPAPGDFRRELTPTWLHLACLLAGHRPPDLSDGFRYVHLGCGKGITTNVVAAVHPDAEVWAWDHRPTAVEATRRLRAEASLTNLTLHERPGLPADLGGGLADLVVIDDVLVAADDDLRALMFAAVGQNLRPGGLVCIAYKTSVGWEEIAPVQHIMRHVAQRHIGHLDELVPGVLDLLDQLRKGGARHLLDRPAVVRWLDELPTLDPARVIEEYLSDDFRPLSHPQVAEQMTAIGCAYAGSARLTDDLGLDMAQDLREIVATAASPALREAYRDLATRPTTRVDLFRLGAAPLTHAERAHALAQVSLVGVSRPEPANDLALSDQAWARLCDGVPATDLASSLDLPAGTAEPVRLLLDAGLAHPTAVGHAPEMAAEPSRTLNDTDAIRMAGLEVMATLGTAVAAGANA